jgi:hypothetical protein
MKYPKSDDAVWRKLRKKLGRLRLQGAHVRVGVFGGVHEDSGFDMVELLATHELGTRDGRIPARAPIATTFREQAPQLTVVLANIADQVITDRLTIRAGLDRLGLWGATMVKRTITTTDLPPPLKPRTIARKGSSKPLVDTAQLVNSISWQVMP